MKRLTLIALSLFSISAFAAKLEVITEFQSETLNTVKANYETLLKGKDSTLGSAIGVRVVKQKMNEKLETIIKQAVKKTHTDYSTPDSVDVTRIPNTTESIKEALNKVYNSYLRSYVSEAAMKEFINENVRKTANSRSITVYEGFHGNSFGDCRFVAFTVFGIREILFIEACYAE